MDDGPFWRTKERGTFSGERIWRAEGVEGRLGRGTSAWNGIVAGLVLMLTLGIVLPTGAAEPKEAGPTGAPGSKPDAKRIHFGSRFADAPIPAPFGKVIAALEIEGEVSLVGGSAGCTVVGTLKRGTNIVSVRPSFRSVRQSLDMLGGGPGLTNFHLRFSGEDIWHSRCGGPYSVDMVLLNAQGRVLDKATHETAGYVFRQFGEFPARILAAKEEPAGARGGPYSGINVIVNIETFAKQFYAVKAMAKIGGKVVAAGTEKATLPSGEAILTVALDGGGFRESESDGPYTLSVEISDARLTQLDSATFQTRKYLASQFQASTNH